MLDRLIWKFSIRFFIPAITLFFYTTHAGSIYVPKKDVNSDCRVFPEPKMGEEFTVTVAFSLKDKIEYWDNPGAGAWIRIVTFPRQEFIRGDSALFGRFVQNEEYSITATFKAINSGKCYIAANLVIKGEKVPCSNPLDGPCIDGYKEIYSNTSISCGEYGIGIDEDYFLRDTVLDSTTGLRITTVTSESGVIPPVKIPYKIEKSFRVPNPQQSPSPKPAMFVQLPIEGYFDEISQAKKGQIIELVFHFRLASDKTPIDYFKLDLESLRKRADKGDTIALNSLNRFSSVQEVAFINTNENLEFLEDPLWIGKLQPFEWYEIHIRARLLNSSKTSVTGIIRTMYAGGSSFEEVVKGNYWSMNYFVYELPIDGEGK